MLLYDLLHLLIVQIIHLIFFDMKIDLRTPLDFEFVFKFANCKRTSSVRFPYEDFVTVVVFSRYFDIVCYKVSAVKSHSELTDKAHVTFSF